MNNLESVFDKYDNELLRWNSVANVARTAVSDNVRLSQQKGYYISELEEFEEAQINNDLVEMMDGLCDVYFTERYLIHLKGYKGDKPTYVTLAEQLLNEDVFTVEDIDRALREVFNSNWSKFPETDDVDPVYEVAYCSDKYSTAIDHKTVKIDGTWHSVFLNTDNKVVKCSKFFEPDLSFVLGGTNA